MQVVKFVAYSALALALALGVGAAYANDLSNDTTGSDSHNTNELNNENNVDVTQSNDANVRAEFNLDMDTGENDVKDNTTVGDFSSGDATGNVSFDVTLDQSSGAGAENGWSDWLGSAADVNLSNHLTGSDSDNHNEVNNTNNVSIDISNNAYVGINYNCDADTGENDILDNTTVGDVSTGDASCSFSGSVNITQD